VVVCSKPEQAEKLAFLQKAAGAILSPFECWLVLRGVKTLAARMEIHDRSGRIVADFLSKHKKVKTVFYPGLPDHPGHEIARRQQSGFGAMLSFELAGGEAAVGSFLTGLECFTLAESLGGVESLIAHPASMTHAGMEESARLRAGIGPGLLRVSVGIEDAADLVADLEAALERAAAHVVAPAAAPIVEHAAKVPLQPHRRRHAS
jgi:cystathionine beta-lyase/cystathionine gamma-synthase